jgi:hypothetical protein
MPDIIYTFNQYVKQQDTTSICIRLPVALVLVAWLCSLKGFVHITATVKFLDQTIDGSLALNRSLAGCCVHTRREARKDDLDAFCTQLPFQPQSFMVVLTEATKGAALTTDSA